MSEELKILRNHLVETIYQAENEGRLYLLRALAVTLVFLDVAIEREEEYERFNRA